MQTNFCPVVDPESRALVQIQTSTWKCSSNYTAHRNDSRIHTLITSTLKIGPHQDRVGLLVAVTSCLPEKARATQPSSGHVQRQVKRDSDVYVGGLAPCPAPSGSALPYPSASANDGMGLGAAGACRAFSLLVMSRGNSLCADRV